MKDKRQRIAVTWPYAAICADPAFAASLLQAAASTVSMPYYAPHPMVPQMPVMPPHIPPPASTHYAYNYRYQPYQIPPRTPLEMPQQTYPPHFAQPLVGAAPSFFSDYSHSPPSSISPQSLSPVSESEKVNFRSLSRSSCQRSSFE